MKRAHLTAERLDEIAARFGAARIAVVGDYFLDKYLDVDPARAEVSVETGKVAHQVVGVRTSPGAAGTVVGNFAALGAGRLHAIGFIGDDGEGHDLRRGLEAMGCDTAGLLTTNRRFTPTYLKPRDADDATLAGEHSRYDTKNRTETPAALVKHTIEAIDAVLGEVDALVVMDQVQEADCGVVTAAVRGAIAERARDHAGVTFWADSRCFIRAFRNVIIKPNQFEVMGLTDPPPGTQASLERVLEAAGRVREATGAPVVVTRGADGMLVSDPEWTEAPGVTVDGPTDPTGAGDSATAGAVLALCGGATLAEAAVVANLVASITVQQIGTTGTARVEQVKERWLGKRD